MKEEKEKEQELIQTESNDYEIDNEEGKRIFSLSSTDPDSTSIFCHFLSNFLQSFCLLAPVRPFYPFFFGLVSFFMHLREIFGPIGFWDFFMFGLFSFTIDQWVFVIG